MKDIFRERERETERERGNEKASRVNGRKGKGHN